MRIFDTNVQKLKYDVLRLLIRNEYENDIENIYTDIPKVISPGPRAQMRCCIYKERAILQERIKLAQGGDKNNPNVVEVIDIACDECPVGGVFVSPACRGCIVHRCHEVCPRNAITIIDKKAVVDKSLCIECGKCAKACPFSAIIEQKRPCITACKAKAITINDETKKAEIDNDKCIECGACVYQCPFGAISDKSYVLDVVNILKSSGNNKNYKVYAVVAPAIAGQFNYAKIEQVITAIKRLGFYSVVEAALGADITLHKEALEFKEKRLLTTSCCPSFVKFVEINYPELKKYVSHSVSPMVETGMLIKRNDPDAKVIFIGPCSSKKNEFKLEKCEGAIDCVISFEELQAFFDARGLEIAQLEESKLNDASELGRIFAVSGGITKGVTKVAEELCVDGLMPIAMNGIDECRAALAKLKFGKASENFFEGMACEGGCLNGALCINHGTKSANDINKFAALSEERGIQKSVSLYEKSLSTVKR